MNKKDKAASAHKARKKTPEFATNEEVMQAAEELMKKYHKALKNLSQR